MKRKQLWKVLGTGVLALSLMLSPMTGLSALAADGDTVTPVSGAKKALDPTQTEEIPAEGDTPAKPAYADTDIPVYGHTQDGTVYSVDVEWGAMTFQYESKTWDPVNHKEIDGAGWKVYDSENEEALEEKKHAINEIKVTNHSNAGVWATLTYAAVNGYTDTTGVFSGPEANSVLTDAAGGVPAYLTLGTANNDLGEGDGVGKETVGTAYFMPDGISADNETNGITKWTTIGTITVGIKTAMPTAETP